MAARVQYRTVGFQKAKAAGSLLWAYRPNQSAQAPSAPKAMSSTQAPGLAAYYWTGGAPAAHQIKDISSTGLYVVTEERWYPGTLVLMTLQNNAFGDEVEERTICVHSRAIRWGKDGVGLQFVLQQESKDLAVAAADRKALDRFLERLRKSQR